MALAAPAMDPASATCLMDKSGYGETIRLDAPYAENSSELTAATPIRGDAWTPFSFHLVVAKLPDGAHHALVQCQWPFIPDRRGQNVHRVLELPLWSSLGTLAIVSTGVPSDLFVAVVLSTNRLEGI